MFSWKTMFKIRRERSSRYERRGDYLDEQGRFHEEIANGVFAIWPTYEAYRKAQS